MHCHSVWYFEEKVHLITPKLKQLQQQCLSPLDFWQCKGCRSPRSRTVGTRLGRAAPWEQASQATPINQIGSISVMVMTTTIIFLSPAKLLIMRSVEQKSSALWESWCPLAGWSCNPSPNLRVTFTKTIDNHNLHLQYFIPSPNLSGISISGMHARPQKIWLPRKIF